MSNPISSAVPADCISKTRRPPLAWSTTLPGTCASMVTARSMQTADPVHMSLVKSYVPAATKILSTALLPTAVVSSAMLAYRDLVQLGGVGRGAAESHA